MDYRKIMDYWKIVNTCHSHEDVYKAEQILNNATDIPPEDLEEMVEALAFIYRELG